MIVFSSKNDVEVRAAGVLLKVVDVLDRPGNIGEVANLNTVFGRISSPGKRDLLMMRYIEGVANIHQIDDGSNQRSLSSAIKHQI